MTPLQIDLYSGWNTIWNAFSHSWSGGFKAFLTAIGVLLILGAVGRFVWQKRRGGGNFTPVAITIIIGVAMSSPELIIPAVLVVIDWVANFFIGLAPKHG